MITDFVVKSNGENIYCLVSTPTSSQILDRSVIYLAGDGSWGSKNAIFKDKYFPVFNSFGLSVIVFDFMGKGNSSGNDSNTTIESGISTLRDVLTFFSQKQFGLTHVGLLGNSYGGNIALNFVVSSPKAIRALALVSPAILYHEIYENNRGWEEIDKWKEDGVEPIKGRPFTAYLEGMNYNPYPKTRDVDIPCFVTYGSEDKTVPISQIKRLEQTYGGDINVKILPGVEHDYGDSINELIPEFANFFNNNL